MTQAAETPRASFDVFISYSHADALLAERLSRRIRRYRPPRALRLGRERLTVFRDVERLTAHHSVADALLERVHQSNHLVVLCSPDAAASPYVDAEVRAFVDRTGGAHLHVVLAAGSVTDALPPAVTAALHDPLYVDLRATGSWRHRLRSFREQSLRVIAALLNVDYASLHREDERRRRRQWLLATAMSLMVALLLGAAWLVNGVPPNAWSRVQVPEEYEGVLLRPFADWAVYREDPEVRIFRAVNAEYVASRPRTPIGIVRTQGPYGSLEEFRNAAREYLTDLGPTSRRDVTVATFTFRLIEETRGGAAMQASGPLRVRGSGEINIRATLRDESNDFIVVGPSSVSFSRSLRYRGTNSSGELLELSLPRVFGLDPFDLEDWLTSLLLEQDALPPWGYLRGTLLTPWSAPPEPLVYRVQDNLDLFDAEREKWRHTVIFTDGDPERVVEVSGRRLRLREIDDKTFELLLRDPSWAVYDRPRYDGASGVSDMSVDGHGNLRVIARGREASIDDDVAKLLQQTVAFTPGMRYEVQHIIRSDPQELELLSVVATEATDAEMMGRPLRAQHFLKRQADGEWRPLPHLSLKAGTVVTDILPLNPDGPNLLLATDREGYLSTSDGGATWVPFNHGESALVLAGGTLETLVVLGEPTAIYALVDRSFDNDDTLGVVRPNLLFRYVHRSWIDRLRVGMATVLSP